MTDVTQSNIAVGRVLVVDDEEPIREIVVSMLVSAGFECREAMSGLEALRLLESGERFDLMLCDVMMNDLDGIGLLERVRVAYPDMPVVMGSAVHDLSVILTCLRRGACDYLLYPFKDREELLDVVRRALEDQRSKQAQKTYVSHLEAQVAELTERLRDQTS